MIQRLLLLLLLAWPGSAWAAPAIVVRLSLHDTVQPVTADYLTRGLHEAARVHASAVLLSLGTPGGLLSSTRDMVATIVQSPVPVVVYISPAGSRAGSAGFFLLEAADIAAMAPGTNAGAAHPVVEGKTMDPVLKEKIENDAAAFLRSYVERRGRNVAAAEDAVRNSKSYSEQEALKLRLIDLTANDEGSLLHMLDGRTIQRIDGRRETLALHDAQVRNVPMSLRERLLNRLTNPDLAVLLVVLGGLLIYLEFNVPGTIVPGALGTLLLLLGVFGLNLLPIRHTALLLLVAAALLIALELKFASHGVLAAAGVGATMLGLATLVDGPVDEMRVHLGTALGAGLGFGAVSFGLAWIGLKARRNKALVGPSAMIGRQALVRALTPEFAQVELRGELWQARTAAGTYGLVPGGTVVVRSIEGLVLIVDPQSPSRPGKPLWVRTQPDRLKVNLSQGKELFPMSIFPLRKLFRTTVSRFALLLFLGNVVFAGSAPGQVQPVSALDRQLQRIDFALLGQGLFNTNTNGTNYLNQPLTDSPGNTLGALVTLRYTAKPYFGLEGNFSYARFTQNYSTIGGVQANTSEYTLGYVVHPGEFFGVRPFVSLGAGSIAYKPTPGGGQQLMTQARAAYYYNVGADDMLTEHIGVRAQFRQSISLAPDFGQNYLTILKRTISTEPAVGVFLRF